MKVLCYGSLNIDYVYEVPHFVEPGETLSSLSMSKNPGGKGANQAAALAKSGCKTFMAGKIGKDGEFLINTLQSYGVDCSFITISDNPSGHAIIQLDEKKQNSILLFPGENKNITYEEINSVLSHFDKDDWILLQNEINNLSYIINKAKEKGMKVCLNPAPFDESIYNLPFSSIDLLIVNEIEGARMAELNSDNYIDILDTLKKKIPNTAIIMTVGENGSYYQNKNNRFHQDIVKCKTEDTTAAGDTFIGFFVSSQIKGYSIEKSMEYAAKASSLAVSKKGAMSSVPFANEVF